jgi:hypothetical protein
MTQPLLTIWNTHTTACAEAPTTTNESNESGNRYYGYFENSFTEQWVFVYDRERKISELRGGDIGWERVVLVRDGQADVILGKDELAWLQACWKAATR